MLIILTSILYNEIVYLDEWIDFHLKQGIDKLYIFIRYKKENRDDNLFNTVKKKYSENLNIIFIHLIWKPFNQIHHFFKNFYKRHINDWMAIIDIDEFLYSPLENKKIPDIIEIYEKEKKYAIGVNWKCFGSNNIDENSEFKVLEKFTKCADKYNGINQSIKSLFKINIIDTNNLFPIKSIHKYPIKKGHRYYTSTGLDYIKHNETNFEKLKSDRKKYLKNINKSAGSTMCNSHYVYVEEYPFLVLNHYIVRSKEEYLMKIKNNSHRKDRYNLNIFNNLNSVLNSEEDTTILNK